MPSDTREQILDSSGELFRRQGYVGTGVKQIVEEAGAPVRLPVPLLPRRQGASWAPRRSAARVRSTACCSASSSGPRSTSSPGSASSSPARRETLIETDYADACPIATVALEVSSTQRGAARGLRRRLQRLDRRRDRALRARRHPGPAGARAGDPGDRLARGRLRPLPRPAQHRAARGRRRGGGQGNARGRAELSGRR